MEEESSKNEVPIYEEKDTRPAMIPIPVCDDDRQFGEAFVLRLKQSFGQLGEQVQIDLFSQAQDCCLAVRDKDYELLFLDIEMEGLDGFGAARQIGFFGEGRKQPLIVFVSAHENLVFDAYEFEPFWFLRKSHLDELKRLLECFLTKRTRKELSYRFKEGRSYRNVRIRDILFLEGSGQGTAFAGGVLGMEGLTVGASYEPIRRDTFRSAD